MLKCLPNYNILYFLSQTTFFDPVYKSIVNIYIYRFISLRVKKIVERRHGEPLKFLFLPKMGLLGSQASTEKKLVLNSELLLRAVFSCFHGQIFFFFFIVGSALKSCLIQKV